jgi:eukaryotic-like serine/threonine-protein kinase
MCILAQVRPVDASGDAPLCAPLTDGLFMTRMPSESARPEFAGTRRFELLRVLGAGGMGVVYEALDRERGSKVALKTVRTLDAEALLRFKNEFRSLQDLQHPNLVSLGELLEEGGQLFFTMELIAGVDFFQHVRPREGVEHPSEMPAPSPSVGSSLFSSLAAAPHITTSPSSITPPPAVLASPVMLPPPRGDSRSSGDLAAGGRLYNESSYGSSGGFRERPPSLPRLRPASKSFNEVRLRSALQQVARGLYALHGANKVHRDIKPSNVLVTEAGRVVILDFGLITDVTAGELGEGPGVVGTAHFMAPEQAAGKAVGTEADWYSLGVMLYLALVGCYPFQLTPDAALDLKQRVEPTPPGLLVDGLPTDLEALCRDLLRIDPAARPTGHEVLSRLGVDEGDSIARPKALLSSATFVGRRAELSELDAAFADALRGRAMTMLVQGESGVGKSALVRHFLERLEGEAVVLSGRCYEREAMPYKAVDELVDALSRYLRKLPPEEMAALVPANAALLSTVFPVLRRVDAIARTPRLPRGAVDPLEIRTLVFDALRELFRGLAARRPLVLSIDDFQWADADSLALLEEVMRPSEPRSEVDVTRPPSVGLSSAILLVATLRAGHDAAPTRTATASLLSLSDVRSLHVRSLPEDDAEELVRRLLSDAGLRAGGEVAAAPSAPGAAPASSSAPSLPVINAGILAREAGGHPLFIDALLRHRLAHGGDNGPARLEEVLWSRIQRLDAPARQLLELVAVSGRPLRREIAARAVGAEIADLLRLTAQLRGGNLVNTAVSSQGELIEPYHDRIRETVLSHLPESEQRAWNERLALALEGSSRVDLESLAVHWRDAGDAGRAAQYAVLAGDQASAALAFDRAARLYRMAADLDLREGPEGRPLLTKLADALGNAGRGAEAAEVYLAATFAGAPPAEALELERRAAENLLRSGYVDEGMGGLNFVLAVVGLEVPETPERALQGLLLRREQIRQGGLHFEERVASEIPPEVLTRIDVCWSASLGLAMVDPIRGADFQTRNLLLSLEAGEPYRVARALALEASFVANAGGPAHNDVAALLAQADAVASRIDAPHAVGLVRGVRGIAMFLEGRWARSVDMLDEADDIFRERCVGVPWERASVRAFGLWDLWFLGDLREFARRTPLYLREAQERGDRYFATSIRSYLTNAYWLMLDSPDAAESHAADAIRRWSKAGFHLQHLFDLVARGQIGLYRGEPDVAYRYLLERWPALDASLILNIQLARILVTHLHARLALARAGLGGRAEASAQLLRAAASCAREIEAERVPWADPLAAMVRAGVAVQQQEQTAAVGLLVAATDGFRTQEMALFEAVARRCLGELQGGEEGRAMAAAAERWMAEQGVKNVERMAAMLAPGFHTRPAS